MLMRPVSRHFLSLVLVLIGIGTAGTPSSADEQDSGDAASAIAATIDARIAERWNAEQVTPAPQADDSEYLRRVYLHLAGKIPRVSEVRAFLDDPSPDKRRAVVNRLLESPAYIVHFTNVWRALMIPEAEADPQIRVGAPAFEAWLREQLTQDVAYDAMVRELITAPRSGNDMRRVPVLPGTEAASPAMFFVAKQNKPENIAAGVSRLFLGVRLECAQCHDHPFAKWERKNFWEFTAFFDSELAGAKVMIPDSKTIVSAAFLDGTPAALQPGEAPEQKLAQWLTSRDNRYFARATVNRLWFHFFGRGLVDPVDDFDDDNPPSHPKLLDELADHLIAQNFDLKPIMRGIIASRPYQLTSRQTDDSQSDPELFAKMAIQGMSTEQLFDSLAEATGFFEPANDRSPVNFGNDSQRARFRELFRNELGGPVDAQTTILQALALMNGEFVETATGLENSTTLAAVVESPFLDTTERVRTLYLATLSRQPDESELAKMVQYVESGGTKNDSKTALGDVFWALLNSSEFILNH